MPTSITVAPGFTKSRVIMPARADGGDQNIGPAAHSRQVASLRMADGDGGIGVQQQHGSGLADDVAASDDHGVLPSDGDVATLQNLDDPGGRARHQAGALGRKEADVHGMEAVNIFRGIDRQQDFLRIHLRRQGQLHQDAVNLAAAVQIFDEREQFGGGRAFGRSVLLAVDSNFFASFHFAAHVDFRRRVVPDQDDGKAGTHSGGGHGLHLCSHLAADVVRDFCTV